MLSEFGVNICQAYQKPSRQLSASQRLALAVDRDVGFSMTSSQALEAQIGSIPSTQELEQRQSYTPTQALNELFAINFMRCTELGLIVQKDIRLPPFISKNLQELVLESLTNESQIAFLNSNGLKSLSMTDCVLGIEDFSRLTKKAPLERLKLNNPWISAYQCNSTQIWEFFEALLKIENLEFSVRQEVIRNLLTPCTDSQARSILYGLERKRLLSSVFFGKAKWEKYFGDIGEEPPPPFHRILWKFLWLLVPFGPNKKSLKHTY